MVQTDQKKLAAGLSFMGCPLGELLELKASCRKRLEYLEANRGRISEYVFNKLRQEYLVYLDAVDGEVALGLSEYEIKLAEIRLFANQLKLLEKSYREKLEELSLRHSLGEFDQARYESLCAEHESKMKRFAGSLEKYQGQKKQIETFLAQARIESSLLDSDEPMAAAALLPRTEPRVEKPVAPPSQPAETGGPPRSSLLELESQFSGPDEKISFEMEPVNEPETPLAADTAGLSGLPGLTAEPLVPAAEEPVTARQPEENLPELPFVAELPDLAAPPSAEAEPELSPAARLEEELPEVPAAAPLETNRPDAIDPFEVAEEPAASAELDNELPAAPAGSQPAERSNDLAAMMGLSVEPEEKPAAGLSLEQSDSSSGKSDSGFDLEHIFGQPQSQPATQPVDELNWDEATPVSARPGQPEDLELPEITASKEQATPVVMEDSLLDDLAGPVPSAESKTSPAESSSANDDSGLDLDDIIDQAGVAGPAVKPQAANPLADQAAPRQDRPGPEISELERDLDLAMEKAAAARPLEPVRMPRVEEPEDLQPVIEPEPEIEPPASLVSLALKRASQDKDEASVPVEESDEVVGFNLSGDSGESEMEIRLTMNQTIDAIKKKTVKCPECGTMNYAIRWYCENCEATLTAL